MANGVVTLAQAGMLNYEASTQHHITVQAQSNDNSTARTMFAIIVKDANEPIGEIIDADDAANTIAEDASTGTAVGITAFATDPDHNAQVSYFLPTGASDSFFALDSTTDPARIVVADSAMLNYEQSTQHHITVAAYNEDGTQTRTFTIHVINVNEMQLTPSVATTAFTVTATANTEVGIGFTATHPDGQPQLSLTAGNQLFKLMADDNMTDNNSYQLITSTAASTGTHLGTSQTVTIRAAYQQDQTEHNITVTVVEQTGIRLRIKLYLEGAVE